MASARQPPRGWSALGIQTGLDLRAQSLAFLQQHFCKAGAYYYWIARGVERERPAGPDRIRKSVGAENTFATNLIRRSMRPRRALHRTIEKVAVLRGQRHPRPDGDAQGQVRRFQPVHAKPDRTGTVASRDRTRADRASRCSEPFLSRVARRPIAGRDAFVAATTIRQPRQFSCGCWLSGQTHRSATPTPPCLHIHHHHRSGGRHHAQPARGRRQRLPAAP